MALQTRFAVLLPNLAGTRTSTQADAGTSTGTNGLPHHAGEGKSVTSRLRGRQRAIHIYVFEPHYRRAVAEAARQGRSLSSLARYALLRYLGVKDEADGLPARPESWIGDGGIDREPASPDSLHAGCPGHGQTVEGPYECPCECEKCRPWESKAGA